MATEIVQTTFNYETLDEDTRIFVKVAAADIQGRLKRTADDIIAIGEQLLAVKSRLEQGLYIQWLRAEFDMSQATSYNFIHVAQKSQSNPEFTTVVNSKNIGAGRVLYALAEASDDTIAKVASGDILPTASAIHERRRAEKAEERASKEEQAHLEAEKKIEDIQMQLSLFQSHSQLAQSRIDELEKQIETIQKPDTVEVPSPELLERLANLEAELKERTEQRDNLARLREQLSKELNEERDANKARREQELYEHRVKQNWQEITDTYKRNIGSLLAQFPSVFDTQIFDNNDWARLDYAKQVTQQFFAECEKLRTVFSVRIVNAEMPTESIEDAVIPLEL